MSEGEFADRIECKDREAIKLLESGAMKPTLQMQKLLIRLLGAGSTRSPKLKKMYEEIKERSQSPLVTNVDFAVDDARNFTEFRP